MLETMSAFHGYEFNMDLTEALYKHLAGDVIDKPVIEVKGQQVDLTGDWRRASMVDLVKEAVDVDFREVTTLDEAERILTSHGVPSQPTVGHALVGLFEAVVEPTLIQPTIVHGHPVEISPLAKATADDPRYVERFEVFVGGTEQGDNWTSSTTPSSCAGASPPSSSGGATVTTTRPTHSTSSSSRPWSTACRRPRASAPASSGWPCS